MATPTDPLNAGASMWRDTRYRLERLERRMAAASVEGWEPQWFDVGADAAEANGAPQPGPCMYSVHPWGHTSYGTMTENGATCPAYSAQPHFWPTVPVTAGGDDWRSVKKEGGPTFARVSVPRGVWEISITVWLRMTFQLPNFVGNSYPSRWQDARLHVRPLSRWPGMDPVSGSFPIDPSTGYYWDGTTYANSGRLIYPGTGWYGIGDQVQSGLYVAGGGNVKGDLSFRYQSSQRFDVGSPAYCTGATTTALTADRYPDISTVLQVNLVDSFVSQEDLHVMGTITGFGPGAAYTNTAAVNATVTAYHATGIQIWPEPLGAPGTGNPSWV